jgi:RES domain-containing protein
VRIFRLIERLHARDVLDGRSAALTGGRWNGRGRAAVYTSLTASLAALERRCHYAGDGVEEAMADLVLARIEVPDQRVEDLAREVLPPRWQRLERLTQSMGDEWLKGYGLALRVPSSIHPYEDNVILNPEAPGFTSSVYVIDIVPFPIDGRIKDG